MKKIISAKLAGSLLAGAFILLAVFHILVLLKVLPANNRLGRHDPKCAAKTGDVGDHCACCQAGVHPDHCC